jgi:hypothetical protein
MPLTKLNSASVIERLPIGSVLQTKKTVISNADSIALGTDTDTVITGFTVNITPLFSNSIILLTGQLMGELSHPHNTMFSFLRDSTKLSHATSSSRNVGIMSMAVSIDSGNNDASTPESLFMQFHDTPLTTNQITYKMTGNTSGTSSTTLFINRTVNDTDDTNHERGVSFIMAQEIKQ